MVTEHPFGRAMFALFKRQIFGNKEKRPKEQKMMATELLFARHSREECAKAMEHDLKQQPPQKRNLLQTISDPEEPFVHPPALRLGDYFFNQKFLILVKPGTSVRAKSV